MRCLYGRNSSINVQKVAWTLAEMSLEFDWIDKNGSIGSIDTEDYREINPAAQVPTFDDNGIYLRQSNAIVRYLSHNYPESKLWPVDLIGYAEAERWMEWQATDLWSVLRPVFWGLIRTKPNDRNMNSIYENINLCHREMELFDDYLTGKHFVAGKMFSMGDIPAGCAIYRYYGLPEKIMRRPYFKNIRAWYDRLKKRSAFKNCVMLPLE